MRFSVLLATAIAIQLTSASARADTECHALDRTLQQHLAGVRDRDLALLTQTITEGHRLTLILPDGTKTDTREAYLAFHREFFSDDRWRMSFEEQNRIESAGFAIVSLKSTFRAEPNAQAKFSWLNMGFRCELGSWRLVFDQNTRVPAEAAP